MIEEYQPRHAAPHEHEWKFDHTYDDWWDGDSDDIYYCTEPECNAVDRRYIGR